MSKICKTCWWSIDHNNTLISRCKTCQYEYSNNNKKQTRISLVSKTNKNTPAKFTKEIKAKILLRDKHCIFCNNAITDIHHVYFWTQSNRTKTRNDENQWVWVCRDCHNEIHSCWIWKWKRQEAILYLINNYK